MSNMSHLLPDILRERCDINPLIRSIIDMAEFYDLSYVEMIETMAEQLAIQSDDYLKEVIDLKIKERPPLIIIKDKEI